MRTVRRTVDPGHEEAIEDLRDSDGQALALVAVVAKCGEEGIRNDERLSDAMIVRLAPGQRRELLGLFSNAEGEGVRVVLVATSCEEYARRRQEGQSAGTIALAPAGTDEPDDVAIAEPHDGAMAGPPPGPPTTPRPPWWKRSLRRVRSDDYDGDED
jgi:hypothetical protein